MKIGLISCVKEKRDGIHKAKDLYISPFFKKSLKYALQNYDKVYILSAKHGLINLDDKIESYELTLNNMNRDERRSWYYKTATRLNEVINTEEDELYFLTGKNYYEGLLPLVRAKGRHIIMENLPSGKRLQWLNQHIRKEEQTVEDMWG